MPNSLIFVVILAVWAAYLIQHWIRRRDHVATAKSVDRFSEAMRVLERRQSMPRADISTPTPRSYSVSLTRPAHPDVVVKRARHGASIAQQHQGVKHLLRRPSAATLRATALAVGALALVVGVTASAIGMTSWWAALAGVAGLLLAVTFVRFSVDSNRRRATSPVRPASRTATVTHGARSTRPVARRPAASKRSAADRAPGDRAPGDRVETRRPAPVRRRPAMNPAVAAATEELSSAASAPAADHSPTASVAGSDPVVARTTELYDLEAFEATATAAPVVEETPVPVVEAELEPGTWAPVPVPPPTYTLKARAPRRDQEVRPEANLPSVEDLPFDGHALALDEEFEDLPPVHSVG